MNEFKKVVTDNPKDNIEALLNYAHDKGGRVVLSYANGEKEKDLSKYISELANSVGCEFTPGEVMDGECLQDCPSCHVQALNICAIQAAELRQRLKRYEDLIESGQLTENNQNGCEMCKDEIFDAYVPVSAEGDYCDKPSEPGEEWVYHANYCPNCGRRLISKEAEDLLKKNREDL